MSVSYRNKKDHWLQVSGLNCWEIYKVTSEMPNGLFGQNLEKV